MAVVLGEAGAIADARRGERAVAEAREMRGANDGIDRATALRAAIVYV
jgi:hypothetical protein